MKYPEVDIEAPILPGVGLGGYRVGIRLAEIQESVHGLGLTLQGSIRVVQYFEARYILGRGEVQIGVDIRVGKVFKVIAGPGYLGAFDGTCAWACLCGRRSRNIQLCPLMAP